MLRWCAGRVLGRGFGDGIVVGVVVRGEFDRVCRVRVDEVSTFPARRICF
jgi:hypothetical protein